MEHHKREKVLGNWVGIVYAFALLILSEYLLYQIAGISFFSFALAGSSMPAVIFFCGCTIGMAWEYIGQFGFGWWYYPAVLKRKWLLILLPLFWGIFMLIIQDFYVIFRVVGFQPINAVIISTLILGFLIEGINLYTHSWIYTNWRAHPVVLTVGWLVLLSYTFVIGFNGHIINIFGI